jgi:hypothetical protein
MKALLAQQSMPDRRNDISFDTALDKSYAGIGDNVGSASGIFDDAKGKQKGSAGVREDGAVVEEPDTKIFAAMFGAGEDDDEEAQRPVEDESTLGVNSRQQKAADAHTHTHTLTGGEGGGGSGGGGRVSLPHSRLVDKVLITSTQIRALIGP